jgi:two-component system, sensor histidine kinase and response regulator
MMTIEPNQPFGPRANDLFAAHQRDIYEHTDRLFAGLMFFQWIAGIVFALWVSPLAWYGAASRTHLHVWAAVILGGIISLFPALLGLLRPGRPSTRYTIAVAQMLMGALLIHLTGGRLETHFHVFGSLAFLAFYRDWRVLVPATIVVALDHMLRGVFWPQSVYGVLVASQWRWLEHAAWVIFEDVFLVVSCRRSIAEMRDTANRTAALEHEVRTRQQAETEARNAKARNDGILDVALDCVILMDESGQIVQFNPAAERTFGYSAAEAVGTELAELIVPADGRGAHRAILSRYIASDQTAALNQRVELSAIRKDGERFPVEVAIAPISSDGSAMFAAYMRDITERRHSEIALAEYTHDLEQAHQTERRNAEQLSKLVDELRVTQRQAEAATRAKSDFLASMSHELRTPLNAIILYSELLQEEAEDTNHQRSVADLQKIQSAGKQLLDLINGILDLSKIEAGKMTLSPERFEIRAMIGELVDTVAPLVQQRNNLLTVKCRDDVGAMTADLMKTRQILLNLLGNAAKFTRDGAIAIDVRRLTVGGRATIQFSVTDTGVGMTREQTGKIFDAFTQADVTTTRKYGGTGLGLAIVSRFCDLMHGSVSVESRPGLGSSFFVHLPAEAPGDVADIIDVADGDDLVESTTPAVVRRV